MCIRDSNEDEYYKKTKSTPIASPTTDSRAPVSNNNNINSYLKTDSRRKC